MQIWMNRTFDGTSLETGRSEGRKCAWEGRGGGGGGGANRGVVMIQGRRKVYMIGGASKSEDN